VLYDEARQRIDACRGQDCDECDENDPGSVNGCGAYPMLKVCDAPVSSPPSPLPPPPPLPITHTCAVPSANLASEFFRAEDIKACFDSFPVDTAGAEKTKRTMLNYLSMYS